MEEGRKKGRQEGRKEGRSASHVASVRACGRVGVFAYAREYGRARVWASACVRVYGRVQACRGAGVRACGSGMRVCVCVCIGGHTGHSFPHLADDSREFVARRKGEPARLDISVMTLPAMPVGPADRRPLAS